MVVAAVAELKQLDMGWAPRVRKVSGIGRSLARCRSRSGKGTGRVGRKIERTDPIVPQGVVASPTMGLDQDRRLGAGSFRPEVRVPPSR
jgi:hypothetical protein